MATKAPTAERGTTNSITGVVPWSSLSTFIDFEETAPDLIWPQSNHVYDKMYSGDAQCKGLYLGATLGIRRFRWRLDPNGADDEKVEKISADYGIPIKGAEELTRPRLRNRFNFANHLEDALRALYYGHYAFEQNGDIGPDGLWHIKKLAPRTPKSIMNIHLTKKGGLDSIEQSIGPNAPKIPVSQLVWYAWDKEGSNWVGKSMFRSIFRNWLLKDILMRLDTIRFERTSGGAPMVEVPEGATEEEALALQAMAEAYRAGEEAGGAVPHGTKPFDWPKGNNANIVGSINMHDEQMARAFLMMFIQLGSTEHGSRALGGDFIEFFSYAQEAIADWFAGIFNEHVIEDDIDWNYGEDTEQVPILVYERDEETLPTSDLVTMIEKKVIKVDDELDGYIRQRYRLPAAEVKPSEEEPEPVPPSPSPAPTGVDGPVAAAGEGRRTQRGAAAGDEATLPSGLRLPPRPLRRQPYEWEVAAATDYANLDAILDSNVASLVATIRMNQQDQIAELHDLIIAANGDEEKLANLRATPVNEAPILERMRAVASDGVNEAVGEAERQGIKEAKRPDLGSLDASLANRAKAMDEVLARSLSEAAARQAIARTATSVPAEDVARDVQSYLAGLSDSYLNDQVNGTLQTALNSGRKATMRQNDAKRLYASELLDRNTCSNCMGVDGTEYESVDAAEFDYAGGGYVECKGGPRCRGTLVAIYDESTPGPGATAKKGGRLRRLFRRES